MNKGNITAIFFLIATGTLITMFYFIVQFRTLKFIDSRINQLANSDCLGTIEYEQKKIIQDTFPDDHQERYFVWCRNGQTVRAEGAVRVGIQGTDEYRYLSMTEAMQALVDASGLKWQAGAGSNK